MIFEWVIVIALIAQGVFIIKIFDQQERHYYMMNELNMRTYMLEKGTTLDTTVRNQ